MGTYDRAVATAKRLIAKSGRSVDLVLFQDGAPGDANQPWRQGAFTESSQSAKAVFLSTSTKTDKDSVPAEERMVLIAASGLTNKPFPKGEIRVASDDRWRILSVEPVSPDGQDILYKVKVAR